jgi:hypothetical protein
MLNIDPLDLDLAKQVQSRRQRRRDQETVDERWERFVQLQGLSFDLLRSSPDGWDHFLRRNMASRRVEVIDGKWQPVSADRRFDEA